MNGEYTWLSIGVYRWKGIAIVMAQVLGTTSESIFGILQRAKQSSGVRGSPRESIFENLKLVLFLAKSFNPNKRELRVPE